MNTDESGKTEWVKAALERYEGPLVRYAVHLTGNLDAARDVVQDTFLRLWGADRAAVEDHLGAWLYTVCRNRALDVIRKERRMVPLDAAPAGDLDVPGKPPSAQAERREAESAVATALRTLPDRQQELIRLKFQDALSYKEISEITGLSVSNVGYLIHTAIHTVRRRLEAPNGLAEQA